MTELEILQSIYELLLSYSSFFNLITGFVQSIIVVFSIIALYKLFKLFF